MKKILKLTLLLGVITSCNYPSIEIKTPSVLAVYPNPAIDYARVSINDSGGQLENVKVYDPRGEIVTEVFVVDPQTLQVYIKNRPEGTYHVFYTTQAKVFKLTFIKK